MGASRPFGRVVVFPGIPQSLRLAGCTRYNLIRFWTEI
jgi:hypothetical protein